MHVLNLNKFQFLFLLETEKRCFYNPDEKANNLCTIIMDFNEFFLIFFWQNSIDKNAKYVNLIE